MGSPLTSKVQGRSQCGSSSQKGILKSWSDRHQEAMKYGLEPGRKITDERYELGGYRLGSQENN